MSSVIAMMYRNEICLASDMLSTDRDSLKPPTMETKQIVINGEIAIGFAGSGNIAQVMMDTLANPINEPIVSKLTLAQIPDALREMYQEHTAKKQYPDEETRHVSALIIGTNDQVPEIVLWRSPGCTDTFRQTNPNNFAASLLAPYDLSDTICKELLWEVAKENADSSSLENIAVEYFKMVSARSEFTSAEATIWVHRIIPRFGQIISTFGKNES